METMERDEYIGESVMRHLRKYGITNQISNGMYNKMCSICYRNYYRYGMDIEFAVKDAVGIVLLEEDMEISGYEIWVA